MKKPKIIAAVFLAGTILVGAGYASWTDKLNITTTASTGNMKVEFINDHSTMKLDYPLLPKNISSFDTPWSSKSLESSGARYVTTGLTKDASNQATITLTNLYPGSGGLYSMAFKNTGSIPLVIDSVVVDNYSKELGSNLCAIAGFLHFEKQSDGGYKVDTQDVIQAIKNLRNQTTTFDSADWKNAIKLNNLQGNLTSLLHGIKMNPGDVITLDIPQDYKETVQQALKSEEIEGFDVNEDNCLIFGLPKSVTNKDIAQGVGNSFSIKINVKQFNK